MVSNRKPRGGLAVALFAATLAVAACSKSATPEIEPESATTPRLDESQVRALAKEIREAHLQLDSERFVDAFAEDGSVTLLPLNKKLAVMERKLMKPYLDKLWGQTTQAEYVARDERITVEGPRATYSATVVENVVMNGLKESQTTEQKWDVELRDGEPKITHMNMKVIER